MSNESFSGNANNNAPSDGNRDKKGGEDRRNKKNNNNRQENKQPQGPPRNEGRGPNNGGRGGGGGGRGRGNGSGSRPQRGGGDVGSHKVDMRKYDRMMSAAHDNFSDIPCTNQTDDCVICCKPNDVFGLGPCRHPVCAECAIRMRVLGGAKACPVCRSDIEILSLCTVSENLETVQLNFPKTSHPDEDRFGIRFSNKISGEKYEKYLAHVCKLCHSEGERLEFPSYISLRQHMANAHQMSYCHICTDNLNLFSRERKTYMRDTLQRHIRIGDNDDRSFKGHPQCLFCEEKFFDAEARYRHLRKEHFFCQFCEADGTMTNVFFGKHDELKLHYKEKHFPCDVEECREMGIAFASKLELDLHRAKDHSEKRNLLDLGFGQGRQGGLHLGGSSGDSRGRQNNSYQPQPRERIAVVPQRTQVVNPQTDPSQFTVVPSAQSRNTSIRYARGPAFTPQSQDFPTLAPAPPALQPNNFPRLNKVNKPQRAEEPVDHFPSLGASPSVAPVRVSVPPVLKKKVPTLPKTVAAAQNQAKSLKQPASSQPQQGVVKVNKQFLRYDMVEDEDRVDTPSAKSNIQLVTKIQHNEPTSSQNSARPPAFGDFPSLPAASSPRQPANTGWVASTAKKGVITSVNVPSNYSTTAKSQNKKKQNKKKTLPTPDAWPTLDRPSTPPAPKVEEWQDVPLSKEAQAEKEKREKKEEWARRKAEIRAAVASASKKQEHESAAVVSSSSSSDEPVQPYRPPSPIAAPTPTVAEEWETVKAAAKLPMKASEAKKKNKNKQGTNDVDPVKESPPITVEERAKSKSSETVVPSRKQEAKEKIVEAPPQTAVSTMPTSDSTETLQQKIDALWNMPTLPSLPSLFSSFSLGGMFSSNTPSPTTSAPPPGLGNLVLTPPPGLSGSSSSAAPPTTSFDSAPVLSHDDVQKKRQMMKEAEESAKKVDDDGWVSTAKPKNKKKK